MLNPGGLRRSDEFVRHKMLDALGDLALAGAPILGAYRGVRAGHGVTNRLLRRLFATPGAFEWSRSMPRRRRICPARASARQTCAAPVEAGRGGQPGAAPRGLRFSFQPPRNLC